MTVEPKTVSSALWLAAACLLAAAWSLPVQAEPVPIDAAPAVQAEPHTLPTVETTVDIDQWMRAEATRALLAPESDEDRRNVLAHGWKPRPPTWIQGSTVVNLGDFPSLDDTAEKAERDLQTLQWVIEEQRRQAAGQATRRADDGSGSTDDDRWFRRLLPRVWISALKDNREWVAAGGTALLVIVWAASIFARRPGSVPPQMDAPPPAPARRRRRRRHSDLQPQ